MKYFLLFLLIWMAFQFIFRLVIPLFMTGRQLRKGFRQMQEQMQAQMREQMRSQQNSAPQPDFGSAHQNGQGNSETRSAGKPFEKTSAPIADDYLEFEEVKESKK